MIGPYILKHQQPKFTQHKKFQKTCLIPKILYHQIIQGNGLNEQFDIQKIKLKHGDHKKLIFSKLNVLVVRNDKGLKSSNTSKKYFRSGFKNQKNNRFSWLMLQEVEMHKGRKMRFIIKQRDFGQIKLNFKSMKFRSKNNDKQTVPLKCFTWDKPDRKSYNSKVQTINQKKYQNSSSDKLKKVEKGYDNLFVLTKNNENCYYSNITVQFTTMNEVNEQEVVLPIFNKDKKYFTPGFIINEDLPYFQQRSVQYEYDQFQEKKKSYQGEANNRSDQFFKRREPRSHYCYVCKKFYENNYYEHIKEGQHKQKMRNSLGEQYILSTLSEFKKDKTIKRRGKQKQIIVDEQDNISEEVVRNYPRKSKIISKEMKFKYFKKEHVQTRSRSFKSNGSSEDQTDCILRSSRRK